MSRKTAYRGLTRHIRMTSLEWMNDALCIGADEDLFFGPDGERQPERDIRERKANAICRDCPVLSSCDEWAIRKGEYGTWAARNEDERTVIRRRRKRQAAAGRTAATPAQEAS